MQMIRCTQKLLKELPMEASEDAAALPSACWHANLLRIDRRKCLLFTHDTTLFSLFVPSKWGQVSHSNIRGSIEKKFQENRRQYIHFIPNVRQTRPVFLRCLSPC